MNPPGVWDAIISAIRGQMQEDTFHRWFGSCTVRHESPEELVIEAPSIFYKNWILEHYGQFIQSTYEKHASPGAKFRIVIAGDAESPGAASDNGAERKRRIRRQQPVPPSNNGCRLNPKYTFENFIEGSCNRYARATCLAAAESPGSAYNPIFVYGGVGLGKTHLMQAVGHFMLSAPNGVRIHYVSSESFTNHLIHSLQTRHMDEFRRSYRDANALLIDDIQFLSGKERTQEEFFHTFNTLFDLRSQIIISSDRPPSELADMEARLVSRFQSGVVVDLQVPDLETRTAILLTHARNLQIQLSEEVAFFIAEKARFNIRELEGALLRVGAYSSLMKHPATVATAQYALKDFLLREASHRTSLEAIQKKVADCFDIRIADMQSRRRPKMIAFPRQVAMYLCRELTDHSLHEIGEAFGGRNHATVIHAHRLVAEKLNSDSKLRLIVTRLREELSRP
ncbi:MAG: chromosomal replication initiator protein DnaA [bacterium]|nr:chromosomal replication initiator protein DnaA [bacterium]